MTLKNINKKKYNRLINENSPYLLQHADNPVNWYPWGNQAFNKAKRENKPIFLSIGYSTCHWCHVMAHESFEDKNVAKILNDSFVSIKVDREERPYIDNIFMTVCQSLTGSGGWPLTIIMTPNKNPFFAGTYIPKESRLGQSGLLVILPKIINLWKNKKEIIQNSANQITQEIRKILKITSGQKLDESIINITFNRLLENFDEENGGFGNYPKFPIPHNIMFLLRYHKKIRNKMLLNMVEKTLIKMRLGGIYDQIGYGFHRYSTDNHWFLPHFEKMLYDQALLALAYIEAYQITKREFYKKTVEEILQYVEEELTSNEGGFYSSQDADSEGVEGKYYIWSYSELKKILSTSEFEIAVNIFNLKKSGNLKSNSPHMVNSKNILFLTKTLSESAIILKIPEKKLSQTVNEVIKKVHSARKLRSPPKTDDKIITSWNGLMVVAYAKAYQMFENEKYLKKCKKADEFFDKKMKMFDGGLFHTYRENKTNIEGNADDYAFMIWGLIELYYSTFQNRYLRKALTLNKYYINHFWDNENGGFFYTSDRADVVINRYKEIYDGALPSSNSVSLVNLIRLFRLTGNLDLEKKSIQMIKLFSNIVKKNPSAHTHFLMGIILAYSPNNKLVIIGEKDNPITKKMIEKVRKPFNPFTEAVLITGNNKKDGSFIIHKEDYKKINNKTTVYVCVNNTCKPPTNNVGKMIEYMS